MDLRTGKTYTTREDAVADGVPEADLFAVDDATRDADVDRPVVKFSKGSFKNYRRDKHSGELVRVR